MGMARYNIDLIQIFTELEQAGLIKLPPEWNLGGACEELWKEFEEKDIHFEKDVKQYILHNWTYLSKVYDRF